MLKLNSILDIYTEAANRLGDTILVMHRAATVYGALFFFSEKPSGYFLFFSFIHGIKWCDFIELLFKVDQTDFSKF